MNKLFKSTALFLVVFMGIPMSFLLCCCEASEASYEADVQTHAHQQNQAHSTHHDHGASDSKHDHSQCEHDKITSNLVKPPVQFSVVPYSFLNSHRMILKVKEIIAGESQASSSSFIDTGPPGSMGSSVPLYLQISLLRI